MRNFKIGAGPSTLTAEALFPADLKFFVDLEILESSIVIGLITADSYEEVRNDNVREFLDERYKESKEKFTIDKVDEISNTEFRMNMRNIN